MTKDWDRYKSEIRTLYVTNGETLEEVRRILKGRHRFEASLRAYRMKLEEWGIRKNKVATSVATDVQSRRPSKPTGGNRASFEARSSNVVSTSMLDMSTSSLTSEPQPISQFQNGQVWTPALQFSANEGPNLGSLRLPAPGTFHDSAPSQQTLHEIILHGTEEEISNLLSSGVSVNTRDGHNDTPLHTAIIRGNIGIVKSLLDYGADIDSIGSHRKTPLHLSLNSKPLVQLLLRHQPKLSLQDDEGNTILHCLLHKRAWWEYLDIRAIIKAMLFSGADVNISNNSGETPLHRLVIDFVLSAEYVDILSEFLNCKPDVTSPMRNGLTMLVVFLDNSDILSKDSTFYDLSLTEVCFRCLEQLLDAGAEPNIMFHSKPLLAYCLENGCIGGNEPSENFLKLLLQKADLDFVWHHGYCPLHLALSRRHPFPSYAITAALIARQANINQTNAIGASPLEIWLARGWRRGSDEIKVALLLVKAGASTTKLTSTRRSIFDSLTSVPKGDQICLTKAFLEADINSQDDGDITASVDWTGVWRSAWKQPRWHLAKARLAQLIRIYTKPEVKQFHECAFVVTAEHLLERHRSQLELWRAGEMAKERVKENYEDYCAILRDCRERQAEVKGSWYTYLLDLMDYS